MSKDHAKEWRKLLQKKAKVIRKTTKASAATLENPFAQFAKVKTSTFDAAGSSLASINEETILLSHDVPNPQKRTFPSPESGDEGSPAESKNKRVYQSKASACVL